METAMLEMPTPAGTTGSQRHAKCLQASKRVSWDIDRDVIRGRRFDFSKKFLPDSLSLVDGVAFLSAAERRMFSQVQGRTYANMFRLVERFIGVKMLDISQAHWLGDQTVLEALVRFTDEELKHQELFRRLDAMMAADMPAGYEFVPQANDVAAFVLGKSTWAVLALVCHIEIFVLAHYRRSIGPDAELSALFKDVMLYHWREEAQHATLDELEWARENARLTPSERDAAVDELIELVAGVNGILQSQAEADARYFTQMIGRPMNATEQTQIRDTLLNAYRWQYIVSGVEEPRFARALAAMTTAQQMNRIGEALAPLMY